MLNAIIKKNWNVLPDRKEDSLTSSVFDYLFLLPDDLIWYIIKESCHQNELLPNNIGKLINTEFWPKWNTKNLNEVTRKNYIEPDVFIEFEHAYIIIEAKVKDENSQDPTQWRNQIIAFEEHFKETEEKKPLIYLAVGGIWTENPVRKAGITVHKIKWENLLATINKVKGELESKQEFLPHNSSYIRILDTILVALEIHGYNNYKWLNTLPRENKINIDTINTIRKWNLKKN